MFLDLLFSILIHSMLDRIMLLFGVTCVTLLTIILIYVLIMQPNFASPRYNTDVILTLHDSSLPLSQCTGFEVGDPFRYVARLSGASACLESEGMFGGVHDLVRIPLEGCRDVFVHEQFCSLGCENVLPTPSIILMFLPNVPSLHRPLSLISMCPLIIL